MTLAINTGQRGNGTVDCGGAQIRAYCRPLATVVTIRGEIDALNVDRVGECIWHFMLGQSAVVLDMSDVSQFASAGLSLLYNLDESCGAAGVEWILVASPAVIELLGDRREMLPTARSMYEALHDLADANANLRQLVLPLIKKTA